MATTSKLPSARTVSTAFDAVVGAALLPATAAGGYLAVLSLPFRLRQPVSAVINLTVVIPAHNEAVDIADTVASVLATDYPTEHRRVLVVADNCTDDTASIARNAGAQVVERQHATLRGKGYALEIGFRRALEDGWADGVVVIDADTLVSKTLLSACASRLAGGASAVQVDYRVRNAERSWRTRLLHIAFTAFHEVRSTGREGLGLSCGLRGNGMAFSRGALSRVPHSAFSIVEDLEYGIALGHAGIRVVYAHDAWVEGHMPTDKAAAGSQRDRWEQGRAQIKARYGAGLIKGAIRKQDKVLADLAADVYVPPLGQLTALLGVGTVAAIGGSALSGRFGSRTWRSPLLGIIGLGGIVVHVAEGWRRSHTGLRGLLDLACAPVYIGWKFGRRVMGGRSGAPAEWVRTEREASNTTRGAS
jgi:1,2-diacylglycerol 3-beta-glucosyltransferase